MPARGKGLFIMENTDCYVYGIVRGSALIYVGRGKASRVYESLREHRGSAFFFFAENITHLEAERIENALLALLNGRLENKAGARITKSTRYYPTPLPLPDDNQRYGNYRYKIERKS